MRFFLAIFALLVALVAATDTAWRDAFLSPASGNDETVEVGTTYPVRWNTAGTSDETVNLYLMCGPKADDLQIYLRIAANIPNNGTYNWTIQTNLWDEPYFALRLALSSHPSNTTTSPQFHLDVLKAENPCYDGYPHECVSPPLPRNWHTRLAIVLGSIFGAMILACAGCCFCIRRRVKRKRAAEAAGELGVEYQGPIKILGVRERLAGEGEGGHEMGSREPSRDVTNGGSQVGLLREDGERW